MPGLTTRGRAAQRILVALTAATVAALALIGSASAAPVQLITNGGFETGDFSGWTTDETDCPLFPWTVSGPGGGWDADTAPAAGAFDAWNGFDGCGPMHYTMYQDVTIPAGTVSASLSWQFRVSADLLTLGSATQPRSLDVTLRDPLSGAQLTSVYHFEASAGAITNSLWIPATADVSTFAGQTVRVLFDEYIPEDLTGPATMELDAIGLQATGYEATIAGPSSTTSQSPTFTFSANRSPSRFVCTLDAVATPATCPAALTLHGLAAGPHTLTVRAKTAGREVSAPASVSWLLTSPGSPHTFIDSAVTSGSNETLTFHSDQAGSRFRCNLDSAAGALPGSLLWKTCSSGITWHGLAGRRGSPAFHAITVRAVNFAGDPDPIGAAVFFVTPAGLD